MTAGPVLAVIIGKTKPRSKIEQNRRSILGYTVPIERAVPSKSRREEGGIPLANLTALLLAAAALVAFVVILILVV